jgi:RNase H-fold protein (predicted Holliday junction resolvase)
VLLQFDGVEIVIGKPADKTYGQDTGGETADHFLANIQAQGVLSSNWVDEQGSAAKRRELAGLVSLL